MKNSKTKAKSKTKRATKHRSMKGKWGKVGAPPKNTKWPVKPFTMEKLFNSNKNQCELSLRNKVDDRVASGELIQLKSKKQPRHGVGRPKTVFVLKENFDAATMEKADVKVKVKKTRTVVSVSATPVVPATTPAVTTAPVETTAPASPVAPVETVTESAAVVETVPAAPEAPAPVVETVTATAPVVSEAPAAPVVPAPSSEPHIG